jgi:hypothetical protein
LDISPDEAFSITLANPAAVPAKLSTKVVAASPIPLATP